MPAKNINILELIPHREPFIMVDALTDVYDNVFKSKFNIRPNNIFLNKNIVSESALIENVAQTCAAGFSFLDKTNKNDDVKIGYIGSITKLNILLEARVGDQLNTTVEIINTFENIYLIKGNVSNNISELINCEMKIVLS